MESSAETLKRPRRSLASLIIEPFKQVKLGLYVIVICLTFLALSGFLFYKAFSEQYQHVINIFSIVDPKLQDELIVNRVFITNAVRLGVLFVLYLIILFAVVFRMTHKVYGPLVSIERFVDEMANGHYDRRVQIRQGDDLGRLVGKLNAMAETFEKKHGRPERRRGADT